MNDEGKNLWSEDDLTERLMNFSLLHVPFTGKEMGCALMFALPLASILLLGSLIA